MARIVECTGNQTHVWAPSLDTPSEVREPKSKYTYPTATEVHYQAVEFCTSRGYISATSHIKCMQNYKDTYKEMTEQ